MLRSRLLAAAAGPDREPQAADLRAVLAGEVTALRADPRRELAARVVELT